ncbi:hypothetical protein X975_01483, partial [Stegodyphus mimosarum]
MEATTEPAMHILTQLPTAMPTIPLFPTGGRSKGLLIDLFRKPVPENRRNISEKN